MWCGADRRVSSLLDGVCACASVGFQCTFRRAQAVAFAALAFSPYNISLLLCAIAAANQ